MTVWTLDITPLISIQITLKLDIWVLKGIPSPDLKCVQPVEEDCLVTWLIEHLCNS